MKKIIIIFMLGTFFCAGEESFVTPRRKKPAELKQDLVQELLEVHKEINSLQRAVLDLSAKGITFTENIDSFFEKASSDSLKEKIKELQTINQSLKQAKKAIEMHEKDFNCIY